MRPESTSVSLRQDLTAVANEYDDSKSSAFIGAAAAPVFASLTDGGNYPIIKRENFVKQTATARDEGSGYNRIIGEFGHGTFACQENGLEYPIDDRMAARYARFFNAEKSAVRILRRRMLLAREIRVAAVYSGAGFTNHNVTTAWSTSSTAVPLTDLITGVDTICDNCGADPSELTIIIPRADILEMVTTTQVANKVQYTYPGIQPAQLNNVQIANMLGVKRVLSARGSKDTNEENYAVSMSQVWTAGQIYVCLLAEPGDSMEEPSAARTIVWTDGMDGVEDLPLVESYRDDSKRSDIVRVREDTNEVLTAEADLMVYRITNT